MRRVIALLVVAVAGGVAFGLSGASSGVSVGATSVSDATMRAEVAAIQSHPGVDCFITALAQGSFTQGAGGQTVGSSGVAAWTGLRVEGLALDQYASDHLHFHATASELAEATTSLEGEMTQAAAAAQYRCPVTAATALGEMPAEMRAAEVAAQAASLELVSRLDTTIQLTAAALTQYYQHHVSAYDKLCVSVALVEPAQVSAFNALAASGASVPALVARFSQDAASKAHQGALGCYAPGNSAYAAVRTDLGASALNHFPTTPATISYQGSQYELFVTATSRTSTPYATAAAQVYQDVVAYNTAEASSVKEQILYEAHVSIDPALGRWGLAANGPEVFAPATPATTNVLGETVLTGTAGTTYR
ncbi:MAG: hypothetical protein ACRDV0_07295 [Acidimicrobiales bacterium]